LKKLKFIVKFNFLNFDTISWSFANKNYWKWILW
jgi:hypothetical protein